MRCVRGYKVKGIRAGNLPGYTRTYRCQTCKKTKKTIEIDPAMLVDLQQQFEDRRLSWNKEKAALKQKIFYLTAPERAGQEKLKRIRQKALELLECTV